MRYAPLVLAFMLVSCAQTGVPTVCSGGPGQPYTCRPNTPSGMQELLQQQQEAASIRDAHAGLASTSSRSSQQDPIDGRGSTVEDRLQPISAGRDEIALERRGSGYLVPVAVNGLPPMDFLLDTGSDVVALPAEVVFTLWRTGTLRSSDFIGNQVFTLADGSKLPSPTFRIRELRVGQQVIRDAVGSLTPLGSWPLLGGSFLSRFAAWKIDNQRKTLVLSR